MGAVFAAYLVDIFDHLLPLPVREQRRLPNPCSRCKPFEVKRVRGIHLGSCYELLHAREAA